MDDLLNSLIAEFKKQKIIRGNIYDNFMFFCYHALGADKDDKYRHTRASVSYTHLTLPTTPYV